jgi:hypothetical protein
MELMMSTQLGEVMASLDQIKRVRKQSEHFVEIMCFLEKASYNRFQEIKFDRATLSALDFRVALYERVLYARYGHIIHGTELSGRFEFFEFDARFLAETQLNEKPLFTLDIDNSGRCQVGEITVQFSGYGDEKLSAREKVVIFIAMEIQRLITVMT